MHNLNVYYALGITHFLGWDVDHHLHGGVKLRARKWLGQKASIDLSGGLLLWGTEGEVFKYPSFVGGASLNFSDWEGLNLTVTTLQTKSYEYAYYEYQGTPNRSFTPSQREVGVYVGYKFSSKPGLALNAAALTTFLVVVVAYIAGGPYD